MSELLHISRRTILRYMKELKEDEREGGFLIHALKGKGYRFEIVDEEKFQQYLKSDEHIRTILLKILLEETCKLDDLAEMFHYSRSGMAHMIGEVTAEIEAHGLKLLSKPYVGFAVHGNEIYIRNYAYDLLKNLDMDQAQTVLRMPKEQTADIQEYVSGCLSRKGIYKRKESEDFFLKYLGIQQRRIRIGQTVSSSFFSDLKSDRHFRDDLKAAEDMLRICGAADDSVLNFEIECVYLALVYRQAFWQNGFTDTVDERDLGFYQKIVETALKRIHQDYQLDLMSDEILVNGLILHIASSYRKYLLGMETENDFHDNILETYPTAYYFAVEIAEEISNHTGLPLSKYEISFLGMHFASFLERNLQSRSWRTVLICKSGMGTAQLLKSRLSNLYPNLKILGLYSIEGWEAEQEPSPVDFLTTTIPLTDRAAKGRAWVQVSPLLTLEEQISLEKMFRRLDGPQKWSCKGVPKFCCYLKGKLKKQEILERICDDHVKKGMISEQEKQGILDRESLVSTEILDGIAMPHGLIQNESFLSFVMLEHPVMWGRTKVKLVILGCFRRGDERMKEELEHIFQMLLKEETKKDLLSCKTIQQMEEKIGGYCEE